jgi:ABC-type glycerol-3-phosphate transport system substrate-binding protein
MKTMSKAIAATGVAAVLALAGCSSSTETDSGATTLMLAVETSAGDPLADMLLAFADEVQKELGDQVRSTLPR